MDVSFDELLDQYFEENFLRPATQNSYRTAVRALRRYIGKGQSPQNIDRSMILNWRREIVKSPGRSHGVRAVSWNNYVRHLSSLYSYGLKFGIIEIESNPFRNVRIPEPKIVKNVFNENEISLMRQALHLKSEAFSADIIPSQQKFYPCWFWRSVFEVFYQTGIRLSQLLRIKLKDINLERNVILLSAEGSKTNSEMLLPIPNGLILFVSEIVVMAAKYKVNKHDQLFNVNKYSVRHSKVEMDIDQVEGFFKKLSACCGFKISPHRLRHGLATDLMNSPERNIHLAQSILNHSSVKTTLGYVHPSIEDMRYAMEQRERKLRRKQKKDRL